MKEETTGSQSCSPVASIGWLSVQNVLKVVQLLLVRMLQSRTGSEQVNQHPIATENLRTRLARHLILDLFTSTVSIKVRHLVKSFQ